ncbi:MAG: hypothetical protein P8H03_00810 [Emcibacteraceae bacterium]|nr:hypothetical protein [Emcibacteraceae bacterium]
MLKQLSFLKTEYKSLKTKLVTELNNKFPNHSEINRIVKLMKRMKTTIQMLISKKSIIRKVRNNRRSRRQNRLSSALKMPSRQYIAF